MKLTKNRFLAGYAVAVLLLALVRLVFPEVAKSHTEESLQQDDVPKVSAGEREDRQSALVQEDNTVPMQQVKHHPVLGVHSYHEAFPDTNAVQLVAARQWGVLPVQNREDAESRKRELVYIGASPYYKVDRLTQSIPYLVPRAAVLLQDIGEAFFDSLQVKGIPLHRLIVTSVLRSQEDVARLRRFNPNASENSCHLYGTTLDIAYNRYDLVTGAEDPSRQVTGSDSLKWVLSEVLRDMRESNRCYIKHEVKQGCFHITVR